MSRSYLIWAPPFDRSAGGIIVLHRFAVELQKRGMNVSISTDVQNPCWPEIPSFGFQLHPSAIAIYPEIIFGNEYNCRTVVRYLLNVPGVIGGPTTFDKTDILYTYSRLFNTKIGLSEDRVMLCPHIELDAFYDMKLPRSGRMVYRGKGQQPDDPRLNKYPLIGHKESFRGDDGQKRLAESLNRCELLYCYDNATAMTDISRLCGCPVVLIPDGSYSWQDYKQYEFWGSGGFGYGIIESSVARATMDSARMRADYEKAEVLFQEKLTEFIALTQEA
jgi:O-antigen biosynthesis protein